MSRLSKTPHSLAGALLIAASAWLGPFELGACASPAVSVVAAEGFYGDIARQVAGPEVKVTSILANPDQDPHLFEASPSVARDVAVASVIIYNGLEYDPWMQALLAASPSPGRSVLVAADLSGRSSGANPHIWFDPSTMRAVARAVAGALAFEDPANAGAYRARLAVLEASLAPIEARIAAIRRRVAGLRVTATEPIAGDIFRALGLDIANIPFQRAVMNSAEPAASEVAEFETSLRTRQVQLLLYNSQATNPTADRMVQIARAAAVPVLAATETQPAGISWQAWIGDCLDSLDRVLIPAINGPAINGPAMNGPAMNGPAMNGPAMNGPAMNGPAMNEPR